jgi:hypothetical protein
MNATTNDEVMWMPCSCGTAGGLDAGESTAAGCGCESDSGCDCASGAPGAKADREVSLERVVMELDMRVRKLEAQRVEATR